MANKKMGDITEDMILLGAVGIGLYFVFKNLLPNFGGGIQNNNAGAAAATTAAGQSDLAQAQATGDQQTLSNSSIAGMASSIDNALQKTTFWTGNPNPDLAAAVAQVDKCNTSVDWYALVNAFGVKNYNTGGNMSLCSWAAIDCTQMGLIAVLQAAIGWANSQGDADTASLVQDLNDTMQGLGVAQTFTNV